MRPPPSCPRCGGQLHAPGLWSSAWECARHGAVQPFHVAPTPNRETLEALLADARVPVWLRWPMPPAWVVTGLGHAGDERTGARASVVVCEGDGPLGGHAEMALVAEEPGIGLGARLAGLAGPDPGAALGDGPPHAKVQAAGHLTALWALPAADGCAAFVGEALAQWLWVVVWPAEAGVVLYESLTLLDLRNRANSPDVDFGAPTPRLAPPAPAAG